MIKYNLKCQNNHEFESWFSDSKEFEKLKKKKMLECIYCNSSNIKKSIMSPNVLNSESDKRKLNSVELKSKEIAKIKKELKKIQKFVENNFKYVGNKFTQEVKDIHYNNKKDKNIYGTTTQQERDELKEEGIELTTIPWIKEEN